MNNLIAFTGVCPRHPLEVNFGAPDHRDTGKGNYTCIADTTSESQQSTWNDDFLGLS
jgi:hypothetical protein